MRRFYKEAAAVGGEVRLDDRPVRTPARNALVVPSERLAAAIAEEWAAQGERIDPRAMPLTGLANAAIDRVAPGKEAFARGLAAYAESDLLCYRADAPRPLVDRQKALWDPILLWARRRFDVDFTVAEGVIHRPQPRATVERLAHAVHTRSPWELAAFSPLVTISGSLVMTLALAEQALSLEEAWAAAVLDERWQAEQWGEDAEAARALAARRSEFDAACLFLSLL